MADTCATKYIQSRSCACRGEFAAATVLALWGPTSRAAGGTVRRRRGLRAAAAALDRLSEARDGLDVELRVEAG